MNAHIRIPFTPAQERRVNRVLEALENHPDRVQAKAVEAIYLGMEYVRLYNKNSFRLNRRS